MKEKHINSSNYLLNYFKNSNDPSINLSFIINSVDQTLYDLNDIRYSIQILKYKGIIATRSDLDQNVFFLTEKGWAFNSFEAILEDERKQIDLNNTLINSSISANRSTRIVNRLFWLTLFASIISAVGTIGTFILELHKKSQNTSTKEQVIQRDTIIKLIKIQCVHDSLINNQ